MGFLVAFGYSSHLCLSTKTYLLLSGLAASLLTYPLMEYLERTNPRAPVTYIKGAAQGKEMEDPQSSFLPEGGATELNRKD